MIKQLNYYLMISIALFISSCNGQSNTKSQIDKKTDRGDIEKIVTKKVKPIKYDDRDVVTNGY